MITPLRQFVSAAALACLSFGSLAAPVQLAPIDFNSLGADAANNGVPTALSSIDGFYLSGAWVYDESMVGAGLPSGVPGSNPEVGGTTNGGFLLNRARSTAAGAITLSIAPLTNGAAPLVNGVQPASAGDYQGQYFTMISVRMFWTGSGTVTAFSGGINKGTEPLIELANSVWSDTPLSFKFADDLKVDTIVFSANGRDLGLDDMAITLTEASTGGGGGGGTVPEPASFALVALALLAAGGASRKKKA